MEIIIRAYKDHDFETLEKIRNDVELQYLLMANPKPNSKTRNRHFNISKFPYLHL